MTGALAAWSVTRHRPTSWPSGRFEAAIGDRLRSGLVREHDRAPFRTCDVRDAARRVVDVAMDLGLDAQVVRGGLDLHGAELDHVWAIVGDRVVDVALPMNAAPFVAALRAFVAGDLAEHELEEAAHSHAFSSRVVGEYPSACRYLGLPVFGSRRDST